MKLDILIVLFGECLNVHGEATKTLASRKTDKTVFFG